MSRGLLALVLFCTSHTCSGCSLAYGYPSIASEICDNGVDDDLDGTRDCDDADCFAGVACAASTPWHADGGVPASPPTFVCPDGWRSVLGADGATTCEPYPEGGASTCDEGFAHFPGEPSCAPVGRACPAGDWPDDLPATGVFYVRPDAPAGGDGTRDRPFSSLSDAVTAASATSGTVVLARGTYDQALSVSMQTVTIRGACAAETHLTSTADGRQILLDVNGGEVTVEDLHFDGAARAIGPQVRSGGTLTLRGVHISRTATAGALALGPATLHVASALVEDTGAVETEFGACVAANGAADLTIERAVFARARGAGVGVETDHRGDVLVRDTVMRDVATFMRLGIGFVIQGTGRWALERVLVEHAHLVGISTSTTLSLDDVIIRDVTRGDTWDEFGGHGIEAVAPIGTHPTPSVDAQRLLVEQTADAALISTGMDVHVDGMVVRGVIARAPDGLFGAGVIMMAPTRATFSHALFTGTAAEALRSTRGATIVLSDAVLRSLGGPGVVADLGAEIDLSRVLVEDVAGAGAYASDRGSLIVAADTLVRRVAPRPDGTGGFGLALQASSVGQLKGIVIEDAASAGLLADQAVVLGTDVVISETALPSCAATCGGGVGVASTNRADVALRRFVVDRAAACGAQLVGAGAFSPSTGTIRGTPAAICSDSTSTAPTSGFTYDASGQAVDLRPRAAPTILPLPDRTG